MYAAGGGFVLVGAFCSVFGKSSAERYKKAFSDISENASKDQANDINIAMREQGIETNIEPVQTKTSQPKQDFEIRRGVKEKIDEAESEPSADFLKVRIDIGGQTR